MEECATCRCGCQSFNVFRGHVRCYRCKREWFFNDLVSLVNETEAQKVPDNNPLELER